MQGNTHEKRKSHRENKMRGNRHTQNPKETADDARALKRRYADIVADMPKCALSSVLRATIAYRLQERHYGLSLCDFTDLSKLFERHGVSFVSVTQQDSRFENPLVRQRSVHLGDPPPSVLWQSLLLPYSSSFTFKKMLHIFTKFGPIIQ
ncbi:MAG: hypothetical protein IIT98_03235 [Kiritimatiellae bacterium]|nr:hypothetical protein [Kiritimatiellia bacterium]